MSMLFLMMAAVAPQAVPADPMAPALEGKAQCRSPDDAKKTCRSFAMYKANGDGTYTSDTMLMIMPGVTVQTSSVVTIRNGAMCGKLTAEQIDKAALFEGPSPMEATKAATIRQQIKTGMAAVIGKEVCSTYKPRPDGAFDTVATVDGVARPGLTLVVRWITSDDGYIVGR